jgi:predicted MFS family arabinose efflux permease
MRNDPADLNLRPYGATQPLPAAPVAQEGGVMRRALRVPEFWLLSGSFFICGATSNGLIGTHFIPHAIDHGIPEVTAASVLAIMGAMNFVGTLASGWLTDRYNPRLLLACYYGFRGLSLLLLPFVSSFGGLTVFAIVFGLDYIATVPPTAALVADIFGRKNVGTVFGWVFCAHQIGAALAAWLGGVARDFTGDYGLAFLTAGVLAGTAALLSLRIGKTPQLAQMEAASA